MNIAQDTPASPAENASASKGVSSEVAQEKAPESKRRRWPIALSVVANVVLFIGLVFAMRAPESVPVDLSKHTQQDIGKAGALAPGMSASSVKALLGEPAVKEISEDQEEWHYCRTGRTVDEYIAIVLKDQKLQRTQYYTVSWMDLAFHYVKQPTEKLLDAGGMGDCRLTVRWGTYGQRTPSYPEHPAARSRNTEPAAGASGAK